MKPQKDGVYEAKMAEYETKKSESEARLHELILLKKELLSRKELLEGMAAEIKKNGITVSEFDEKLWRLMVESVEVDENGKLVFTLRNGMEIEV
jgi:mannitol/fructose-specific phosphotransferase system IIA component (Ntr-type)